jgi:hypothetical protein
VQAKTLDAQQLPVGGRPDWPAGSEVTAGSHLASRNKCMLTTLIKTVIFVLPLGLDVLSVSTALGTLGLAGWARWRVSLVLASCQIGAMLIGLGTWCGARRSDR